MTYTEPTMTNGHAPFVTQCAITSGTDAQHACEIDRPERH